MVNRAIRAPGISEIGFIEQTVGKTAQTGRFEITCCEMNVSVFNSRSEAYEKDNKDIERKEKR